MAVAAPEPSPPPATRAPDPAAPPAGLTKVNWSAAVAAFSPPAVVATTSTRPGGRAGEGTTMTVSLEDRKLVRGTRTTVPGDCGLPKPTEVAAVKPLPVIVMMVPPADVPLAGVMPLIAGFGAL